MKILLILFVWGCHSGMEPAMAVSHNFMRLHQTYHFLI